MASSQTKHTAKRQQVKRQAMLENHLIHFSPKRTKVNLAAFSHHLNIFCIFVTNCFTNGEKISPL
jgi:hypothetical protein